jgi:hypothetical protein
VTSEVIGLFEDAGLLRLDLDVVTGGEMRQICGRLPALT